jgi:trehalose synthase-fused probable maltokinase
VIGDYVQARRWFRSKAKKLTSAAVDERFELATSEGVVTFLIVLCAFEGGATERYVLPIGSVPEDERERIVRERPHVVLRDGPGGEGAAQIDVTGSERLLAALLGVFDTGGARAETPRGTLAVRPFGGFAEQRGSSTAPRVTTTEQTNTSVVFGDAYVLKIIRKLDEGRSAELEMGEFLTQNGYAGAPAVVGAIEIERASGEPWTVAVLHRFVANQGDAWTRALAEIAKDSSPSAYRSRAERLGTRVGEMHIVLAGGKGAAFVPEPLTRDVRRALGGSVMAEARALAAHLGEGDLARIAARVDAFIDLPIDPIRMRVHGDLHLGQILVTGSDFVIIDFEGEPARSLAERKAKRSPLADVAGMLRSCDYAAATVLREKSAPQARAWYRATADAFIAAWRSVTAGTPLVTTPPTAFATCLDFSLLEKCLYEIAYEANNRPDWIAIPRDGLQDLLHTPQDRP